MPQKLPWMVRKEKYIQIGQQLYNQLEYEKFTTTASETTPTSTGTCTFAPATYIQVV